MNLFVPRHVQSDNDSNDFHAQYLDISPPRWPEWPIPDFSTELQAWVGRHHSGSAETGS